MQPRAIGIDILIDQAQDEDPELIATFRADADADLPRLRHERAQSGPDRARGRSSSCAASCASGGRAGPPGQHPHGARSRGRRDPALARRERRPAAAARQRDDRRPSRIPQLYAAASTSACRHADLDEVPVFTESARSELVAGMPRRRRCRRHDRGPLRADRRRHQRSRRFRDADDPLQPGAG